MKCEGIKKYKLPVMKNSHGDVKHSAGNAVRNFVITVAGGQRLLELRGGHSVCV